MAYNKLKLLKIVNPLIGTLFMVQAVTGIGHGLIPYEVFEKLHGTTGYLLVFGISTHVVLNWSWIKVNFLKKT
jgi:hypothetical protein